MINHISVSLGGKVCGVFFRFNNSDFQKRKTLWFVVA